MDFDFLLVTSWSDFDTKVRRSIAQELEKEGYNTAVVTPTRKTASIVGSAPTRTFTLESLEPDETLTPEEIETYFEIPSLRQFCFTEQAYYHLSYQEVLARAVKLAPKFTQIFSSHNFRYSFQGRGGELFRLFVHAGIRTNGGTSIWNSFSPFDDTVSFSTSLRNTWDAYETITYEAMNDQERADTIEFMKQFREEKKRYKYETPKNNDEADSQWLPSETLSRLTSATRSIVNTERPRNLKRSLKYNVRKKTYRHLNELLLPDLSTSRNLCNQHTYVLVPLQFQEESRLTIMSPQFYDQQWLVEFLSRSLPHSVKLFIKQHPNHAGQESPKWIKEFSSKSNVEFLHPDLNAHYAIEHAEATIVTNNTAGFETLFYSTPLIVLGDAFYGDTPAAKNINDLSSLAERIPAIIEKGVTEDERIASIHSLKEATYEAAGHEEIDRHGKGVADSIQQFIHKHIT